MAPSKSLHIALLYSGLVNNNGQTVSSPIQSLLETKKNQDKKSSNTIHSHDEISIVPDSLHFDQQPANCDLPPLLSKMEALAKQNAATFLIPGHNLGRAAPSSLVQLFGSKPFLYDFSTVRGTDTLHCVEDPIVEAQKQAAKLFGASETWFLVNGTTIGIQAAIMATCSPGEYLILPRNSHKSAISGLVLSGAVPKFIIPEYDQDWDLAYGVTPLQVENAIKELEMKGKRPAAVLITSPTYQGICNDVHGISKVCRAYKIPLIVDEAHGAHLTFLPELPPSALDQGADLAIQSTHKVLFSLTQSSMLHVSGNNVDRERINTSLQTLQSTSPSFLLLASLDATTAELSKNHSIIFNEALHLVTKAKKILLKIPGVALLDCPENPNFLAIDPLRLTIGFWQLGLSGNEADEILRMDHGVLCELVGTKSVTFVITPGTTRDHMKRLISGIQQISARYYNKRGMVDNNCERLRAFDEMEMMLTPRDAFFARKRRVVIRESLGKICGELICPYPPGIPAMIPGEIITEKSLDYLLHVLTIGVQIKGASDSSLSTVLVCDI
ncbi:hypothetical protein ACFE04_011898 [Oxalis oulophora]